jgi:hypothetical protein
MYSLKEIRPVLGGPKTRVGKLSDGGYVLLEEQLRRTRALVSFGVATDWSFEEEFYRRAGHPRVLMFDHSISFPLILVKLAAKLAKLEWLKAAHYLRAAVRFIAFIVLNGRVMFVKKFLGPAESARDVTFDGVMGTLDGAMKEGGGVFVKLDIEGGEYDLLPVIARHSGAINGMAIEFHDLDTMGGRLGAVMAVLGEHFAVVHVHGNNYTGLVAGTGLPVSIEVTLVNRSLVVPSPPPDPGPFPSPGLDYPNDPSKADYQLDFS